MKHFLAFVAIFSLFSCSADSPRKRVISDFTGSWKFHLGDVVEGHKPDFDDSGWRALDLPHDWSIEGAFSKEHPATPGGGALPGGIGWYRKTFTLEEADRDRLFFIEFDGVYRNSEVWINGHSLGVRPYGYSSFQYALTPFLNFGAQKNLLAVRVDNSQQPNSRWYSGSGIYRNVRLLSTGKIYVDHWGTFITTPRVSATEARVVIQTRVRNEEHQERKITLRTTILDAAGVKIATVKSEQVILADAAAVFNQTATIAHPKLWSVEEPVLYTAVTTVEKGGIQDEYCTTFGIRTFRLDRERGFFLNDQPVQIRGVCNHHDLGCLGAAVNRRALERQLEMLKSMGVNGIRTSHNPPAPELLDLCDRMGFIVMDEAFDMWKMKKTEYDYALDWDAWHQRDLQDMVLRDRNHPSIFFWSIGNEVLEQYNPKDSSGIFIARELTALVKALDDTRLVTAACNHIYPENPVIRSGALEVIGFNYHHELWEELPTNFPGQSFVGTETNSALATRGSYDMPATQIRRWPIRWDLPFTTGNPDNTCSSYDNCSAPWGSTHAETWEKMQKYPYLTGMYIWTGFDYLGEPTPYSWPSRSSYFGVIDLAGFPKDAYYFYQSAWTEKPVLHLLPHWNWKEGQAIDVVAYSNCDEVELFLNGASQGVRRKDAAKFSFSWNLVYMPGTLKAVGRKGGEEVLSQEVKTAGAPARIVLEADRNAIRADGVDLSFVTVKIVDAAGIVAPRADNLVRFSLQGPGKIAGVDNGLQTSHESFQADHRQAFNGFCLAVVQSNQGTGKIVLNAVSEGLQGGMVEMEAK